MTTWRTLPEALDDAARSPCGYVFIEEGAERHRAYSTIRDVSLRCACALRMAGVRPGDLVAIAIEQAEPFLTALFGVSLAGAIPAPLAPPAATTTTDRSSYLDLAAAVLRASAARAIITTAELAGSFETLIGACPDLQMVLPREALDAAVEDCGNRPALDDLALVQFTSGSTSRPQGVALSHRNLAANIEAINGHAGLGTGRDDVGVSWLPLHHDMGLVGMALGPLYSARPGVLMPPHAFVRRPAEWLKAIARHRATVSFAPNFAYELAARRVKDVAGLDLSSWRVAGCGAEPIHAPTLALFAERFAPAGFRASSFLPCYGLAEHVLAAALPPRDRAPRVDYLSSDALAQERRAVAEPAAASSVAVVSCGRALPGHCIQIAGDEGQPLGEREVGEIRLAGPSVMVGYYREPELTAETIRDGWLHTGDLGYLSEGELFVCGRLKDLIIVNGRKFHPQDLEWAVAGIPGIRRGGVVAFATKNGPGMLSLSDRVVMLVEPSGTAAADALVDAVRRRIAAVFGLFVDEVLVVPGGSIGRTTSGKVQRAAARAKYDA
jgi:fatty-acyl-CoA synthase